MRKPRLGGALLGSALMLMTNGAFALDPEPPPRRTPGLDQAEDPLYEPTASDSEAGSWGAGSTPPPEEDPVPFVRGAELRKELPDLVVRERLPPFRFWFGYSAHFPLVGAGLGAGVEFNLWTVLQLRAEYGLGARVSYELKPAFGMYGEASVGVRLLKFTSEREFDVYPKFSVASPRSSRRKAERPRADYRAGVPAHHFFHVEGGAFTGPLETAVCVAQCGVLPEEEEVWAVHLQQLFFPFAGFHYTYSVDATSRNRPDITRRQRVELFVHLIRKPFNSLPSYVTHWGFGTVGREEYGGRSGINFPFCRNGKCPTLGLELGYLPVPATVWATLKVMGSASIWFGD